MKNRIQDLKISQSLWRVKCPEMWYRAAGCAVAWVLQDHGAVATSQNTHPSTQHICRNTWIFMKQDVREMASSWHSAQLCAISLHTYRYI
jgi:hypothetical protein